MFYVGQLQLFSVSTSLPVVQRCLGYSVSSTVAANMFTTLFYALNGKSLSVEMLIVSTNDISPQSLRINTCVLIKWYS